MAIVYAGFVMEILLENARELCATFMRYYWYRLADAMIPAGTAILMVALVSRTKAHHKLGNLFKYAPLLLSACLIIFQAERALTHRVKHPRPDADEQTLTLTGFPERDAKIYQDWRDACQWAKQKLLQIPIFLTPRKQQTFQVVRTSSRSGQLERYSTRCASSGGMEAKDE